MRIPAECPCCGGAVQVEVNCGEEPMTYANGRHYPGCPPHIEEVVGCQCREFLALHFSGGGEIYDGRLEESIGEITEDDFVDGDHLYERSREEELV